MRTFPADRFCYYNLETSLLDANQLLLVLAAPMRNLSALSLIRAHLIRHFSTIYGPQQKLCSIDIIDEKYGVLIKGNLQLACDALLVSQFISFQLYQTILSTLKAGLLILDR